MENPNPWTPPIGEPNKPEGKHKQEAFLLALITSLFKQYERGEEPKFGVFVMQGGETPDAMINLHTMDAMTVEAFVRGIATLFRLTIDGRNMDIADAMAHFQWHVTHRDVRGSSIPDLTHPHDIPPSA